MTERRFEYDPDLVQDCATSSVAMCLMTTTGTSSSLEIHNNNGIRSQQQPVLYNEKDEEEESAVLRDNLDDSYNRTKDEEDDHDDESCRKLFALHAQHYGRNHTMEESMLIRYNNNNNYRVGSKMKTFIRNVVRVHHHNTKQQEQELQLRRVSRRSNYYRVSLNRFSDGTTNTDLTVVDPQLDHTAAWSSLSPVQQEPAPSLRHQQRRQPGRGRRIVVSGKEGTTTTMHEGRHRRGQRPRQHRSLLEHNDTESVVGQKIESTHAHHHVVLSTAELIMEYGTTTLGRRRELLLSNNNQLYFKNKNKQRTSNNNKVTTFYQYPTPIRLPEQEIIDNPQNVDPFRTPTLDSAMDGTLVSIKRNKHHQANDRYDDNDDASSSSSAAMQNPPPQQDYGQDDHHRISDGNSNNSDRFATYLNWATTDNPDGVGIVHEAMDQGSCGSCWASSAAGSVEASAARREGYIAYHNYLDRWTSSSGDTTTSNETDTSQSAEWIMTEALRYAQSVEQQSLQTLNLSIQELLDCDTEVDQGCTGGNPLLAFQFIHDYGLVHSDQYPYVGYQQTCMGHQQPPQQTMDPVATVSAWGILPANSEYHMELALRYIGPIAVGINGADAAFLAYDGGIFAKDNCKHGANHALLIVGYGQEEVEDPTYANAEYNSTGSSNVVRYWIARNSWGRGWGEDGYIRIQRSSSSETATNTPGMCGIARSPSVALGGRMLLLRPSTTNENMKDPTWSTAAGGQSSPVGPLLNVDDTDCNHLPGRDKCNDGRQHGVLSSWFDRNYAVVLGVMGILVALLVVWPLSRDCRRRTSRRRRRQQQQRVNGSSDVASCFDSTRTTQEELSNLIPTSVSSYGTTTTSDNNNGTSHNNNNEDL